MFKGIYLASGKDYYPGYDIIYQDINGLRDLPGDMMDYDLSEYDFIIATPPCNYYSRANWRRNKSEYSLSTKHLLPDIIKKLINYGKPFIVENVRNDNLFNKLGYYDFNCFIFKYGRHTYWTNIMLGNIIKEFKPKNIQYIKVIDRQSDSDNHFVIEKFLEYIYN